MMRVKRTNQRGRVRDILPGVHLGRWPTGKLNSITDVPGVLVHVESIHTDSQANTGITTILPRKDWHKFSSFAGLFRFNGCGEMTGSHWIDETGLLTSPIVITESSAIGDAFRGIHDYIIQHLVGENEDPDLFIFPVVSETYGGFLSNQKAFAVKPEHAVKGILKATADRVPEGNTGGGTAMICHGQKGGTGSSSRVVEGVDSNGIKAPYTVGVLVQANYGTMDTLRIAGVPVGRIIKEQDAAAAADVEREKVRKDGSIIIVVATDAPLTPVQLQRLAKRATVGVSKVGNYGYNTSGDIFLAFSTGNKIPVQEFPMPKGSPYVPETKVVEMTDNDTMTGLFEAAADATEEAIYNALCMAETVTGYKGRTVKALDLDKVRDIFAGLPKGW